MSVILSVYSKNAFKEFVLPAENDTEVTLLLEHSMFQIRKDIALKLEVLDGKWYFQEMDERIHMGDADYDKKHWRIRTATPWFRLIRKCWPLWCAWWKAPSMSMISTACMISAK